MHLVHSRPAIKKYILANNKSTASSPAVFDSQFNKALRTGVEKGDFTQPKGMHSQQVLRLHQVSYPNDLLRDFIAIYLSQWLPHSNVRIAVNKEYT